jgi:hypothetical protein
MGHTIVDQSGGRHSILDLVSRFDRLIVDFTWTSLIPFDIATVITMTDTAQAVPLELHMLDDLLTICNSMCNLFIYLLCGTTFRKSFIVVFRNFLPFCVKSDNDPRPSQTSADPRRTSRAMDDPYQLRLENFCVTTVTASATNDKW